MTQAEAYLELTKQCLPGHWCECSWIHFVNVIPMRPGRMSQTRPIGSWC